MRKSPIHDRQSELEKTEEELRRRMERLQKLIDEAPRLEAERRQRQREMLIEQSRTERRIEAPASLHARSLHAHTQTRNPRRLKSEQKAQRIRFITLFIVLSILTILLLTKLSQVI